MDIFTPYDVYFLCYPACEQDVFVLESWHINEDGAWQKVKNKNSENFEKEIDKRCDKPGNLQFQIIIRKLKKFSRFRTSHSSSTKSTAILNCPFEVILPFTSSIAMHTPVYRFSLSPRLNPIVHELRFIIYVSHRATFNSFNMYEG